MDRFDRIYRLHSLLSNHRYPVALKKIQENLECSRATADRVIETLRDYLDAPLEYDRKANGYFYNQSSSCKRYELPGLWFNAEELHGLLICQQILQNITPGILSQQIASLEQRIAEMLSRENSPQPVLADKIYFPSIGRRLSDDGQFKRIATGLFSGRTLQIHYRSRGDNVITKRTIFPQKLVYYRENWYLVAYCHYRNQLRLFAVDRIFAVQVQDNVIKVIPQKQLDEFIHASYGIFSGKAEQIAILEFSKERAKWVAEEHWHPEQQGKWLEDGRYQLSLPFSDSRELIMDILKHGSDVEVIAPGFLRQAVKDKIMAMKRIYD